MLNWCFYLGSSYICTAITIYFAFNLGDSEVMRCIEKERQALLKFKDGLDPYTYYFKMKLRESN